MDSVCCVLIGQAIDPLVEPMYHALGLRCGDAFRIGPSGGEQRAWLGNLGLGGTCNLISWRGFKTCRRDS